MNHTRYDITIIGGGIVGLATGMNFVQRYPRYRFLIVEKESNIAFHQTGHNSGVIHSGIYYVPGSLKAKLCVRGVKALLEFAHKNHIPYELCGKIILATQENEIPSLHSLFERGKANGVPGLELIKRDRIRELEPAAAGFCGIYSPMTGIISYPKVAQVMAEHYRQHGGELITATQAIGIKKVSLSKHVVVTNQGEIETDFIVNCGGLYSDVIAKMMGVNPEVRIVPFRGEYYMLHESKRDLVRNLIYPVPSPELPFLGVHFTRTIDGQMEVGPNAVLALKREGYRRSDFSSSEFLEMVADIRFWKMICKYWKTGIFEFYHAVSKASFARALQAMVPSVTEEDLTQGPTGVRAQCIKKDGSLANDFEIIESRRSIHVLNVPSPAATSALTIADYIVKLAAHSFCLKD